MAANTFVVTSNAEVVANNTALTTLNPTALVNVGNVANGTTFRFQFGGIKIPGGGINNQYNSGDTVNIHFGANGNAADQIIATATNPTSGDNILFEKMMVTFAAIKASNAQTVYFGATVGTAIGTGTIVGGGIGTYSNTAVGSANVNLGANSGNNFLSASYQSQTGQNNSVYFALGVIEKLN